VKKAVFAEGFSFQTRVSRRNQSSSLLKNLESGGQALTFNPRHRAAGRPRHWWVARELVDLVADW